MYCWKISQFWRTHFNVHLAGGFPSQPCQIAGRVFRLFWHCYPTKSWDSDYKFPREVIPWGAVLPGISISFCPIFTFKKVVTIVNLGDYNLQRSPWRCHPGKSLLKPRNRRNGKLKGKHVLDTCLGESFSFSGTYPQTYRNLQQGATCKRLM